MSTHPHPSDIHTPSRHALPPRGYPHPKIRNSGSQSSSVAIFRRPDGPRSSRFQLSAYFCTLFLVRWVPGLKSFNLIDFINLGSVSRWVGSHELPNPQTKIVANMTTPPIHTKIVAKTTTPPLDPHLVLVAKMTGGRCGSAIISRRPYPSNPHPLRQGDN